jgi:hypothetical protein
MKTVNVTELEGAALDWATGVSLGHKVHNSNNVGGLSISEPYSKHDRFIWSPSTDWSQCGPVISSEYIDVWHSLLGTEHDVVWCAQAPCGRIYRAPTPLIAACRAIVAAKVGDTVDVPEELL